MYQTFLSLVLAVSAPPTGAPTFPPTTPAAPGFVPVAPPSAPAGIDSSRRSAVPSQAIVKHCLVTLIDQVQVPATEAGLLKKLYVQEGYVVDENAEIAQIDDSDAQARKRAAEAEMEVAKKEAKNDAEVRAAEKGARVAENEFRKSEEIDRSRPGTVSRFELNRLKFQWDKSELQIEVGRMGMEIKGLEANVKTAQVDVVNNEIRRRKVLSPLQGIVERVFKKQGEWCQPGDPIVRIVHMSRLRIEGFVKQDAFAPEELLGRPVNVKVKLTRGEAPRQGRITFVSSVVENGGMYRIWTEVDNVERNGLWELRPGLEAEMLIDTGAPVARLPGR